jgi:thiamine-phosphate pyrophosphorylase
MPRDPRLRGLYAITDPSLCGDDLAGSVAAALAGGARIVQYRDKGNDLPRRLAEAKRLAGLCRDHGALFIVNDDIELAHASAADGVHLGVDDGDLAQARARLGDSAVIGVSCYNDLQRARTASAQGADYLAFGRFFPSRSKPQAVPASLDLLRRARAVLDRPLVAIGGVTPENGRCLIEAGADMLAVIEALFGRPDVTTAGRAFQSLFETIQTETTT